MTAAEFVKGLPGRVTPESIKDSSTCFHFDLSGDGGGQLTVLIEKGEILVLEGLQRTPKCVVKGKAKNFMMVVNKEVNPLIALLTGQIKVSNQGELTRYAKIFGLMK